MLIAHRSQVKNSLTYRIVAGIVRPLMLIFTRRDWRHGERLRLPGGIIVCSNHISNFDPMVLAHFMHDNGRPPRFLAKSEIFKVKVLGPIIRRAGQIPVHRGTSDAANALREAEVAVLAGEAVAIYPEGTHTNDPQLWPMTGLTGAARLALATGAPVVPVAQWGAQLVIPRWSKGLNLHQRHVMHVIAGDPVDLAEFLGKPVDNAMLQLATARIIDDITRLLEELRGESAPQPRWDRRRRDDVRAEVVD